MYTGRLNPHGAIASHLEELSRKQRGYEWLGAIEDAVERREAARLVDYLVGQEIAVPDSLGSELGDTPHAMVALRASVEAVHPDRKCVSFLLNGFAGWLKAVAPSSRQAFLDGLPQLAPAVHDLGDEGMRLVTAAVSVAPSVMASLSAYALTTADAIRAMAKLAARAAESDCVDALETFTGAFPAALMEDNKEARKLLPVVEHAAAAVGDSACDALLRLAAAITARSVSSANGTLGRVAEAAKRVINPRSYLEDFAILVRWIGIQACGVGLEKLPEWHKQHGAERVRVFVEVAAAIARGNGARAGEAFLEQKTPAALGELD